MSQIPVNLSLPRQNPDKCSPLASAHGWSDFLGVAASIGCAIHCAALPICLAVLPAWGMGWMAHESTHKWMFVACFLIAIVAFIPSLFRHKNVAPIALGSVGLVCIGMGAFSSGACSCADCSRCVAVAESSESVPRTIVEANSSKFQKVVSPVKGSSKNLAAVKAEPNPLDAQMVTSQPIEDAKYCWSLITIWITPVGGVLLVAAHLLNHHLGNFVCRC